MFKKSTLTICISLIFIMLLLWKMYDMQMKKDSVIGSDFSAKPTLSLNVRTATTTMNSQIIEINSGKTVTVNDLKITHESSGHKILSNEAGGGDVSFAEIGLETPRKQKEIRMLMLDQGKKEESFIFDNYSLVVKRIDWNGNPVVLEVTSFSQSK